MSKMLVLEKVRKTFGRLVAVDDVSLDIIPGEFICFLGPSGCGKTTILRMITGFEQPTSGNILYDGTIINNIIPQKRDFGIVFQSYALFSKYDCREKHSIWFKYEESPSRNNKGEGSRNIKTLRP